MSSWYLRKTLTNTGNAFGFSGTNITFDFDPSLTKVVEKITKKYLADILKPFSNKYINLLPSLNIMVDGKQLTWEWNITGSLTNDTGNMNSIGVSPTTSNTAANKKNLLIAFAEQGKTMNWVERNSSLTYSVNVISMDFEDEECEATTYGGTAEATMKDNESRIKFTIVLRKATDRV